MKNTTFFLTTTLSVLVLLTATAVVFAQQLNTPIDSGIQSAPGSTVENDLPIFDDITTPSPSANVSKTTQCSDGKDNDGDGRIDMKDSDCYSKDDDFEGKSQCSDAIDNDNDGLIDMRDPDCYHESDDFEGKSQCSDAIDNDKDGLIDMRDPDCHHESDDFEGSFNMLSPTELIPEIQSAIDSLEVKPAQIFNPVFSTITNLVVNPAIEDAKLVYHLELPDNKTIYKENELIQPIFDLDVGKPVEFKPSISQIIVNDEQIIDYSALPKEKFRREFYNALITENEKILPLAQAELESAEEGSETIKRWKIEIYCEEMRDDEGDESPYNLGLNFIEYNDVIGGIHPEMLPNKYMESFKNGLQVPIYSDFKLENKKLYLLDNQTLKAVAVLPPEIISNYQLNYKNSNIYPESQFLLKKISLGLENEPEQTYKGKPLLSIDLKENNPIYNLVVEEPFKLFWFIPMKIDSQYIIDAENGEIIKEKKPFWAIGKKKDIGRWKLEHWQPS